MRPCKAIPLPGVRLPYFSTQQVTCRPLLSSTKGPPPQETVPVDPSPLAPALPHLAGCFHLPTMDGEALMCQKDSCGPAVGALAV